MVKLKQIVYNLDENAMCFVGDIREAFGEGFTKFRGQTPGKVCLKWTKKTSKNYSYTNYTMFSNLICVKVIWYLIRF